MCSLHRIRTMGECRRRRLGLGSVGQQPLQLPGPRAAPAAADTLCGNSRGRVGGRRGGRLGGSLGAGGARAPGVGAGSRRCRRAPRVPAREEEREPAGETALLAAPASGRRSPDPALPCPTLVLGPAPVGARDARREAFQPRREVFERGGQRPSAGARVMGKTWRPRVGTLRDPSSLLSVSKRLLGLKSESQIRWCV